MLPSTKLAEESAGIWPETKIWPLARMAWDCGLIVRWLSCNCIMCRYVELVCWSGLFRYGGVAPKVDGAGIADGGGDDDVRKGRQL